MNRQTAFQPFDNLRQRAEEVAASLGLTIMKFVVEPPDHIHIIFGVEPDAVMSEYEKEQRKIDKEFAAMERQFEQDGIMETKAEIMKKDIASWLDEDE